MAAIGGIVAAISLVLVIYALIQKRKAGKLTSVPVLSTADAAAARGADPKGMVSTYGTVSTARQLLSPCTQTPCLYYELKVVGTWKEGDTNKSHDYIDEKQSAGITLDDGSGPVRVDPGQGGDFEGLKESFNEEKKEGLLADLKGALGKGKPIPFGSYAFENPVNSKADKFRCIEKVLPVTPSLFASGKVAAGTIGRPDGMFGSLVLSPKTHAELLTATTGESAKFLKGGAIGFVVGLIVMTIGNMMH